MGFTVTGVCVDALNACLITTGLDGNVIWWDMKTHDHQFTFATKSPISISEIVRVRSIAQHFNLG